MMALYFFVSHDHDFINNLATAFSFLRPKGIESYQGIIADYLYQKDFQKQI